MKRLRDEKPRSKAIPERMSGNEAVSYAIRQVNPDVMPAFPITPSTEIPQMVSTFIANGEVDTEFIPVESEHSAMSAAIGAEAAGARTMTATSSAGLALMWEELLLAASNRLPIVLTLVNRTLSGPININCDHSDGMGARDTGWIQIYSENNQEAYDNYIQAFPIAEDPRVHLPVMICQDGFITSHAVENISLLEFIGQMEDPSLRDYLKTIWEAMKEAVARGLATEGILPGGLGVARKAKLLYEKRCYNESADVTMNRLLAAYAYAVSEENADENLVVTAPTCGSCGVLPAVLYYMHADRGFPEEEILDALAVAGLVGNVIRTNASISGAECGCQAEIGSACSMTAAAVAALLKLNIDQIEYAAEIAMEHNLGLTCDPVGGLVQIPCIERNAVAAMRAISSVTLSRFLYTTRKISFDDVVATMYRTGLDMDEKYRETSHGGLAVIYKAK